MFTFIGTQMCGNSTPKDILCRPMDDDKITNITNELNNIDWAVMDHLNIDDAYTLMVSKIQNALKTIKIPYKKILRQPWMTPALLKSSQTKRIMYKKCLGKSKESQTYQNCIKYRNTYNRLKRTSKQNYYASELTKYKYNPNTTWDIEHIHWEKQYSGWNF